MSLKLKIIALLCCLCTAINCLHLASNSYPVVFSWLTSIPLVGWIIAYNFPPSDFYTPLAETNLLEGVHVLNFIGKYAGRYEIQISPIINPSLYESKITIHVQVFNSKNELLFEQKHSNSRIWGGKTLDGIMVYNYCYGIFFAPEDFQLGERITVRIECTGDTQAILEHNPLSRIRIMKVFDK